MTSSLATSLANRVARFRELGAKIIDCSLTIPEAIEFHHLSLLLSAASTLGELPDGTFEPGYLNSLTAGMDTWARVTRSELMAAQQAAKGQATWN